MKTIFNKNLTIELSLSSPMTSDPRFCQKVLNFFSSPKKIPFFRKVLKMFLKMLDFLPDNQGIEGGVGKPKKPDSLFMTRN